MTRPARGLWQQPELLKLWIGVSILAFGSQVTLLALPLIAVTMLGASPVAMGVLGAAQLAPYLLFGLFAGVWVDRSRRRPILIVADIGRAVLLGSVPVAVLIDTASMTYLCLVAAMGVQVAVVWILLSLARMLGERPEYALAPR